MTQSIIKDEQGNNSNVVIVRVPLALGAEVSYSSGRTEIMNPPTLMVAVDRIAYETNKALMMSHVYKHVKALSKDQQEVNHE